MAQTITITYPKAGSTVTGTVAVAVAVTNVGQVNFSVDGKYVGSDYKAPFSWTLDTTKLKDGTHTIQAASANGAVHAFITLTVANQTTAHLHADFTVEA